MINMKGEIFLTYDQDQVFLDALVSIIGGKSYCYLLLKK